MLASLFMREISEIGTDLGILNKYIVDMNTMDIRLSLVHIRK